MLKQAGQSRRQVEAKLFMRCWLVDLFVANEVRRWKHERLQTPFQK